MKTADEKMAARYTVRVTANPSGSITATLEKKGCASREATASSRDAAIAGALCYVADRLRPMVRVVDGADPVKVAPFHDPRVWRNGVLVPVCLDGAGKIVPALF